MASEPKLIQICLVNDGDDAETVWAQDLGPAKGTDRAPKGSRKARIVNVPFLHAKPTWGDVVMVSPDSDGTPTWDAGGTAWSDLASRLLEDSGRFAMIVDYAPRKGAADGAAAFRAIAKACEISKQLADNDIVCESEYGPTPEDAGRVYLAVKDALEPADVMTRLHAAKPPCALTQIHPELPAPKARRKAKATKPAPKAKVKATAKPRAKAPAKPKPKAKSAAKPKPRRK
ncbi:MAG: hypothetical protein WKG01_04275 [Kofleriaceae bacterium]